MTNRSKRIDFGVKPINVTYRKLVIPEPKPITISEPKTYSETAFIEVLARSTQGLAFRTPTLVDMIGKWFSPNVMPVEFQEKWRKVQRGEESVHGMAKSLGKWFGYRVGKDYCGMTIEVIREGKHGNQYRINTKPTYRKLADRLNREKQEGDEWTRFLGNTYVLTYGRPFTAAALIDTLIEHEAGDVLPTDLQWKFDKQVREGSTARLTNSLGQALSRRVGLVHGDYELSAAGKASSTGATEYLVTPV